MASLRRVKGLLILNLVAVVGFLLFLARCRAPLKGWESVQAAQSRAESTNLTYRGAPPVQQAVLKRLSLLEDIVYRQLNGLSKSLGLIEGFGGRGQGGLPATLTTEEEREAAGAYEKYGYNTYLSNRISLDRSIPDYRPSRCKELSYPKNLPQISLIFIFVNEALSVILRSVHSAVNHTPAHLLKEIILVDDNSDDEELKAPLEEYVHKRYPGLVKVVRNQKREGLIRARVQGWRAATALITGFFDAHVEFSAGWVEPILARIKEDRKRIILPSIDNIKHKTFEVQRYENSAHGYSWELWCMYISPLKEWWERADPTLPIRKAELEKESLFENHLKWMSLPEPLRSLNTEDDDRLFANGLDLLVPYRTPAMIGCSFVVNRLFFGEIGLLDPGMDVYGGENIELGIKVWLCGGSMEVLPCSRVAHIERMKKPYNSDIGFYTKRNSLRVAEVWMDDYKSHVYMAWNIPMDNPGIDIGDISERVALRKHLKCKNFQWYLDNVYPEMRRYNNTVAYGEVRNNKAKDFCLDQGPPENHTAILYPCHGMSPQLVRYTKERYINLGSLGSIVQLPDTQCLVDNKKSRYPQLLDCEKVRNVYQKSWRFVQNGSILNLETGRCLEVENNKKAEFGIELVLQQCTGQKWTIKNVLKQAT